MPKFFAHRVKASELNHNDLANIGLSDHHVKYTDAEAVAAAKADADIADAITKKHTQNTDTALGLQTADLDMNTHKVVGVIDPVANQDAATKKYVDDRTYTSRARAYRATTNQTIPNAIWAKIELNAETYDEQGEFDPITNYRFTATKAGYYQVNVVVLCYPTVGGHLHIIRLYKNGAAWISSHTQNSIGDYFGVVFADIVYLAANDYLELYFNQQTGSDEDVYYGENNTFMAIHKLS